MSYSSFYDGESAAATLSNLVVGGKKDIAILASNFLYPIYTTEPNKGRFIVTDVYFHATNTGSSNTLTFSCSIGFGSPSYNEICPSVVRGNAGSASTDWPTQIRVNKPIRFTTRLDSTYYASATPDGVATTIYLYVPSGSGPSTTITADVMVIGYYTGVRL